LILAGLIVLVHENITETVIVWIVCLFFC